MKEPFIDWAGEVVALVLEVVLFGTLTTIGVLSEQVGIVNVTNGQTLGLWYVYVGILALYAGYAIGYERLLPHLREALG